MKVSLKRGYVLSQAALKMVQTVTVEPVLRFSVFDQIIDDDLIQRMVKEHERKIIDHHELVIALTTAGYKIREQLEHAKLQHGISDLLNRQERVKKSEALYRGLIDRITLGAGSAEVTVAALKLRSERLRNVQQVDRFSAPETTVPLRVVTDTIIAELKSKVARLAEQRVQINDLLTVRNVSNFIVLTAETITTLKVAQIISDAADDELADQPPV